jgi:putative NADH-flavin reductase
MGLDTFDKAGGITITTKNHTRHRSQESKSENIAVKSTGYKRLLWVSTAGSADMGKHSALSDKPTPKISSTPIYADETRVK